MESILQLVRDEPPSPFTSPSYWEVRLLDYDSGTLTVMEDSGVGPEGAEALATALRCNPHCTPSCLQVGHGNGIGAQGMTALARVLMDRPWDGGPVGEDAPSSPSRQGPVTPTLKRLSIGQNDLGPEGAASIASALSNNSSLTMLWIGNNNIGPEGAAALAEGLNMNHTLEGLSVLDVSIGEAGELSIAGAIRDSPAILSSFCGTFNLCKYAVSVFGLPAEAAHYNNIAILEALGKKKAALRRRLPALWLASSTADGTPMAVVKQGRQNIMYRVPYDVARMIVMYI